jgi:hypothetical protein
LKVNENLNQLNGWTNGGPLVKLVKGEGCATRARALARLTEPGRAVAVAVAVAEDEGEARRVVSWRVCKESDAR